MKSLSQTRCLKTVPFTSRPRPQRFVRSTNVQVFAKKNRGKGSPEPVSLRNLNREERTAAGPSFPPVDKDNAEIVIYFRTDKNPQWMPFNLINAKDSPQLNLLIRSCDSAWGRALFQKTLIKGLASTMYKERKTLEKNIRKGNMQMYGNTAGGEFKWGMKIRDRNDTAAVPSTAGITEFPPEADVNETFIDTFKKFMDQSLNGPSAPAMPAATEADSKQA